MKVLRKSLLAILILLPITSTAQWKVGVTGGATHNHYVIDKQYQTDYHYVDRWGMTAGLMGQYEVYDWLGIRAELSICQKNYRQTRYVKNTLDYHYTNNYLLLPVMASFSFGGQRLRGFCNVGAFGGYWLNRRLTGTDYNSFAGRMYRINECVDMNSESDQRWDFGFLGGLGMEYLFASHWSAQIEVRYNYSIVSSQKDYMLAYSPRYHSTLVLQAGICYLF